MAFRLKVFSYPWHIGHQFDLSQMPWMGEYHMLVNKFRKWNSQARPEPSNLRWVTHYEPGEYDLAILHLDQEALDPKHPKFQLYSAVNELVGDSCPKVVINHMTPFHDTIPDEQVIPLMSHLVGDTPMVVNSHQAAEQWGWGTPIIHGFPNDRFSQNDGYREPRIISFVSPRGLEKAYQREFHKLVHERVRSEGYPFIWLGVDHSPACHEAYLEYLSRSTVYFHGLSDSPMPRTRTEAQHSGCCVVTTPHHDAGGIWTHGEDGLLISNDTSPENVLEVSNLLISLISSDVRQAHVVGAAGKAMAQEKLGWKRYAADWEKLLCTVL